jgi:hypothetical protein
MESLDGRRAIGAHGDSDMPVWGEIFRQQAASDLTRQAEVRGKIIFITEHLRSIQEK